MLGSHDLLRKCRSSFAPNYRTCRDYLLLCCRRLSRAAWKERSVQHLISQYGYLAVFVLMLAESACIPVPSEVIMMFGGALAAGPVAGAHPSLTGVFAAGVLGTIAGS